MGSNPLGDKGADDVGRQLHGGGKAVGGYTRWMKSQL
jgi:hypothetical protein